MLAPTDIESFIFGYPGDAQPGVDGDPLTALVDPIGGFTSNDAASSDQQAVLRTNVYDGHNAIEFDGVNDNYFAGHAMTGATKALLLIADFDNAGRTWVAANQYANNNAGIWADGAGRGRSTGLLRTNLLAEYPERVPFSGRHAILINSGADFYEMFIDGASQGKRPGSPSPDDYLNMGSNGQGGSFSKMLMFGCWYSDAALTSEQCSGLNSWSCDTFGIANRVEFSNREASAWVWDSDKNIVATLPEEEDSVIEMCARQLPNGSLVAVWTGGFFTSTTILGRSTDNGETWTKQGPIMGNGNGGESGDCFRPNLVLHPSNPSILYLFYSQGVSGGGNWKRAVSTDGGATWGGNTVCLSTSETPDSGIGWANSGTVIKEGVWYTLIEAQGTANSWRIFRTSSTDGLDWDAPVLVPELNRSMDGAPGMFGGPCLTIFNNAFHVWYHASLGYEFDANTPTTNYHAVSENFTDWTQIQCPSMWRTDDPFRGELAAFDQIADPHVESLQDGTTVAWCEDVDNANGIGRILRLTLPFQFGPPPTFPPTVESATINAAGTTLTLVFTQDVTGVDAADYQLSGRTLSSATGAGDTWAFTISPAVYDGDVRTLSYDGTATLGTDDVPLEAFSGAAVTNNSTQEAPSDNPVMRNRYTSRGRYQTT